MIRFVRKGLKTYYEATDIRELKHVFDSLSHFMDGAEFSQKYKDNIWDGRVKFYDKRGGFFWFGLIDDVIANLKKRNIQYALEGYDIQDSSWIKFSELFLSNERDFQREAIVKFIEKTYGTIIIPTRGGKTFVASEIIRLLHKQKLVKSTIFIVDSVDLYKQAAGDISRVLKIPISEIGGIRGDEFRIKPITIAMIQTLQSILSIKPRTYRGRQPSKEDIKKHRIRKKTTLEYLRSVDFTIIDEIHEYGSSRSKIDTIRKISNPKYILSITATREKISNKIHLVNIESFCGKVVYEIEENTLVDKKVLAKSKTLLLLYDNPSDDFNDERTYKEIFDDQIIRDAVRNKIITTTISVSKKLMLKTLVMFSSVKHGKVISDLTNIRFLSGEDGIKIRMAIKNTFLNEGGGVLLVSDIWKKGITLPEVEIFLNADGGKETTLILQRRGRVLGVTESKKKALSIDIIDTLPRYLNDHSLSRISAYESRTGQANIDVIDCSDVEFENTLEDYLINWFELNIQA